MGVRSLISLGLLLVPIAITVGVLMGLDAYRASTGQPGMFVNNKVQTDIYCDITTGIHPTSQGEEYTLNPNPWGWTPSQQGHSCLHVTTHGNGSYATELSAPSWWVTWQYPPKGGDLPVYGYPNIMVDSRNTLPVQVSTLKNINMDVTWGYSVGSEPTTGFDLASLTANNAAANVAIDMFFDPDKSASTIPSECDYEIMVWLGHFNRAVVPVGYDSGPKGSFTSPNGYIFDLYAGSNEKGQIVLSWYSQDAGVTDFKEDLQLFITQLSSVPGITAPKSTDYLGYLSIGTETFFANANVTFSVPRMTIEVLHS